MLKKCVYFFGGVFIVNALIWTQIPNVATTFGIADATAKSIVNYILSASTAVSVISVIGIIFGVGGFSLAAIQTVKYLAKKSFVKAVAW
jgi:circularin A/uberolysin family circular bacteriocin